MVTTIIVMIFGLVVSLFISKWTSKSIRKADSLREDEPFEFTEINLSTPTPTPDYKKKKSTRKPKVTK